MAEVSTAEKEDLESRAGDAVGRIARGGRGSGRSAAILSVLLDSSGLGERADRLDRFVELRRACASLKAATEIRCDESEAMLPPRGRAS